MFELLHPENVWPLSGHVKKLICAAAESKIFYWLTIPSSAEISPFISCFFFALFFKIRVYSLLTENVFVDFRVFFLSIGICLFFCLFPSPSSPPSFHFQLFLFMLNFCLLSCSRAQFWQPALWCTILQLLLLSSMLEIALK